MALVAVYATQCLDIVWLESLQVLGHKVKPELVFTGNWLLVKNRDGKLPDRHRFSPPWVKIPEDLKDPEVFRVQTLLLNSLFGPQGSRIPYIEKVSHAMFELKTLEFSELTEVLVYGSFNNKLRAKWMLQSMAERYCLRQKKGMLKLEEVMMTLELDQCAE
ncbi:hypothetical protein STEG23_018502 [Scotinomys teguina]